MAEPGVDSKSDERMIPIKHTETVAAEVDDGKTCNTVAGSATEPGNGCSPQKVTPDSTTQSHSTAPSSPFSTDVKAAEKAASSVKSGEGVDGKVAAEKQPSAGEIKDSATRSTELPRNSDSKIVSHSGTQGRQKSAGTQNKSGEECDRPAETTAKDLSDDAKHKKVEAGPAARLQSLLNKNRSREDLEAENNGLRKELNSLRKKLTETMDECDACRNAITCFLALAKEKKWSAEQFQEAAKILTVKDRKGKKDDYHTDALVGISGARAPRRRQGRKKKGGKRSHSETQVRRSGSGGEGCSDGSASEDSVGREVDHAPKRMSFRQGKRRHPQDLSASGQQFPRVPLSGRAYRRRDRDSPNDERRRPRGHNQESDKQSYTATQRGKYDDIRHPDNRGKNNARSDNGGGDDLECELIRSSLRNATGITELEEAITKAQAKSMQYEVQLGNRKLQRMKQCDSPSAFVAG